MRVRLLALQKTISCYYRDSKKYCSRSPETRECKAADLKTLQKISPRDAHMNELPVPCGSWDQMYKEKKQWYELWLTIGLVWWTFSLGMMIFTGSFYLNFAPPLVPGRPGAWRMPPC